jgi:DnaJ homolog subfamily C member 19
MMRVSLVSRLAGGQVRGQDRRIVGATSTAASRLAAFHNDTHYHSSHTHHNARPFSIVSNDWHSYALGGGRRRDEEQQQRQEGRRRLPGAIGTRSYHTTVRSERAVAIIMGLGSLSAAAYAGSAAVKSYNEWKASQPTDEEWEAIRKKEEERAAQQEQNQTSGADSSSSNNNSTQTDADAPRENIFKEWFGVGVGASYYQGGFEDTMNKREAALILGVRESSSAKKIKDAHRRLLVLNHPDTGGSTFVAGKINEAKELLLKGNKR